MNLNLKVYFKDKIVKVKIYNKIKVKEVLNILRHELRIPQENELILMNDKGRLSDLEELTEKEMKNLKEKLKWSKKNMKKSWYKVNQLMVI